MKIKIERGIPVPPNDKARRYPVNELKVGESFAVGVDNRDYHNLRAALRRYADKEKEFTVRRMENCYRCWRIK
jgi:hypothetical protein